jgi:hypothetical protein
MHHTICHSYTCGAYDLFWLCDRKCLSHGDPSNHPRRWTRRDMLGHFSNRGSPDLSLLPRPQIPQALQFGNDAICLSSSSNVRSQESHAHKTTDKRVAHLLQELIATIHMAEDLNHVGGGRNFLRNFGNTSHCHMNQNPKSKNKSSN